MKSSFFLSITSHVILLFAGTDDMIDDLDKKTNLVSATFNNCRINLIKYFNLELTFSALLQAGILPDTFGAQFCGSVANTSEWLDSMMTEFCKCTCKEFEVVVDILRDTIDQAGEAHEELVQELEETFYRLKEKGYTCIHSMGLK